jgi:hydrogenase maturation protease
MTEPGVIEQSMTEQILTGRTLVAGVGNVFLRDDAFGVEVIRLLGERRDPSGVQIRDFGIRGVHLVYDLLDGCDLFVLVDAAARGDAPGTVTVLEVEPQVPPAEAGAPIIDAHSMTPDGIFALLASLGGRPGRSLLVACEPADVSAGMGLSEPVQAALPHAVRAVEEILHEHRTQREKAQAQEGGGPDADQAHQGGRSSSSARDGD